MDFEQFKREMGLAETMAKRERENYWRGYQRGLRRAYHGNKFGTPEEHEKFLDAVNSLDEGRRVVAAVQDPNPRVEKKPERRWLASLFG